MSRLEEETHESNESAAVALTQSSRMARGAAIPASFGALGALLVLVLATSQADALNRNELYPYSTPGAATLQTEPSGTVQSAEVQLQTPIKLYDKEYNTIFVSFHSL